MLHVHKLFASLLAVLPLVAGTASAQAPVVSLGAGPGWHRAGAQTHGVAIGHRGRAPRAYPARYPVRNVDALLANLRALLGGKHEGPIRDAVALNAGAALCIAGQAADLQDGYIRAQALLRSGAALERVDALARASRENA